MTMLRWMNRVSREDRIRNEYVRDSIDAASIVNETRREEIK